MRSAIAIALFLVSGAAFASQAGVVIAKTAIVHQYPNGTSPEIGTLAQGAKIRISSDLTRDMHRVYWYKVQLPTGEFGYVRVTDVKGEQLEQELMRAGVTKPGPKFERHEDE